MVNNVGRPSATREAATVKGCNDNFTVNAACETGFPREFPAFSSVWSSLGKWERKGELEDGKIEPSPECSVSSIPQMVAPCLLSGNGTARQKNRFLHSKTTMYLPVQQHLHYFQVGFLSFPLFTLLIYNTLLYQGKPKWSRRTLPYNNIPMWNSGSTINTDAHMLKSTSDMQPSTSTIIVL